jgi:ABC-type transport system involved in cytochrome c biogenesis permease subunit
MSSNPTGLGDRFAANLPPLAEIDRAVYRTIAFGFPLLTMVIITGAVWAQHVWQRWWSWDPKETASLVTWLIYAGYLHGRRNRGWRGSTSARFAVLGFLAVLFTFAGLNVLTSLLGVNSLHAYGMAEGTLSTAFKQGFKDVSPAEAWLTTGFFLAYLVAFLVALRGAVWGKAGSGVASIVIAGLGLLAQTIVLAIRAVDAGRVTFTSGYDFTLWFVWGITVCGFVVAVRGARLALVASLPISLLVSMYGYLYYTEKGHAALMPALQNKLWLHVHVALAIFAYGALALAAGWGALYLIKRAITGGSDVEEAAAAG